MAVPTRVNETTMVGLTGSILRESGETITIGKGVALTLTASTTPGEYKVRVECDTDDGTIPVTIRTLTVIGPGAP